MFNTLENFEKISETMEVNKQIQSRLQEVREAIGKNLQNERQQQLLDAEINKKMEKLSVEGVKMSVAEKNLAIANIQNLRQQKNILSRVNIVSKQMTKTMDRHTALMNQSEQLLRRMQDRELQAVGMMAKMHAKALNAKDQVTVSLIQNEVQAESRKYRRPLVNEENKIQNLREDFKNSNNPEPVKAPEPAKAPKLIMVTAENQKEMLAQIIKESKDQNLDEVMKKYEYVNIGEGEIESLKNKDQMLENAFGKEGLKSIRAIGPEHTPPDISVKAQNTTVDKDKIVAKQEPTKVETFIAGLSVAEKRELLTALESNLKQENDTQRAIVDGKEVTVKHTKKEEKKPELKAEEKKPEPKKEEKMSMGERARKQGLRYSQEEVRNGEKESREQQEQRKLQEQAAEKAQGSGFDQSF